MKPSKTQVIAGLVGAAIIVALLKYAKTASAPAVVKTVAGYLS